MADRIVMASCKGGREEGSVLGGLGGLLDGDNSWSSFRPTMEQLKNNNGEDANG
jgi:hypothetical protein